MENNTFLERPMTKKCPSQASKPLPFITRESFPGESTAHGKETLRQRKIFDRILQELSLALIWRS